LGGIFVTFVAVVFPTVFYETS